MIRRCAPLTLICIFGWLCLSFASVQPVRADVGIPPWSVPGSPPHPGDHDTQVQMVSENVLLVIESHADSDVLSVHGGTLAANHMIGHVKATFQMRNQGTQAEAFDVWFPLWTPEYSYEIVNAQNFVAWVDGVQVDVSNVYHDSSIQGPIEDLTLWATWFVSFPVDRDVEIRVQYDIYPTGNQPYGTFHYILETGADWSGGIDEATITYRLPYPVNEVNTALQPGSRGMFGPTVPNPPDPTIAGGDVIWQFADLEPTTDDNIQLTVMDPVVWLEIEAAQQAADVNPDSFAAQLRLAYALADGLEIYKVLHSQASSLELAAQALDAFERALVLSPDEASIEDIIAYLNLYHYEMWRKNALMHYPSEEPLWLLLEKMNAPDAYVVPVSEYLGLIYYTLDARYGSDKEDSTLPPDAFLAVVARAIELDPNRAGWFEYWETLLEIRGPQQVEPTTTPSPTPEPTVTEPPPTIAPTITSFPARADAPQAGGRLCPGTLSLAIGVVVASRLLSWRRRSNR